MGIVEVPEGRSGAWEVKKFIVCPTKSKLDHVASHDGRYAPPGDYTQLTHRGRIIMSDTPDELRDHATFIRLAHGRVLIHGLGLGMCLKKILEYDDVDHVDVVELSEDVIKLVGPTYESDRVHIHHGDAMTFRFPPGTRWDVIWHDIWSTLCTDNLHEMHKLHRRYGRRCDHWQGSWGREYLERAVREEKKESQIYNVFRH